MRVLIDSEAPLPNTAVDVTESVIAAIDRPGTAKKYAAPTALSVRVLIDSEAPLPNTAVDVTESVVPIMEIILPERKTAPPILFSVVAEIDSDGGDRKIAAPTASPVVVSTERLTGFMYTSAVNPEKLPTL